MSNLIFFGTPDFAVPSLQALQQFCQQAGHHLLGVVCQPDKAVGRGQKLQAPATKVYAKQHALTVWQPAKITADFTSWFKTQNVDLAVVVAYGKILPTALLDASRLGFVNVHGSLLPKWRGAAPIQRAIEAGDKETGISIMHLVLEMDAGDVYKTVRTPILPEETSGQLFERLAPLGAEALLDTLPGILAQTTPKIPQPAAGISHAKRLSKEEAHILFDQPAQNIVHQVLARDPWPGSYALYQGYKIKLFKPRLLDEAVSKKPGQITRATTTLVVEAQDFCIEFQEGQTEGRRRMPILDLLNGFEMQPGGLLC